MLAAGIDTAEIGSAIGAAVGVSVSVIVVVSFIMGVSMASVLWYISRKSHTARSHSNPATVCNEVITNRNVGDAMER